MKKGFTLLEILIVIIIIAILATFAIPQYIRAAKRAIASEAISVIGSIKGALARYYQEHGALPETFSSGEDSWPLDIDDPASVAGGANFSYTVSVTDSSSLSGYAITAIGEKTSRAAGLEVHYYGSDNTYEVLYNEERIAGTGTGGGS